MPRVATGSDREHWGRGAVWIDDPRELHVQRIALETPTRGGLALELKTLLARYLGRDVQIVAYSYDQPESYIGIQVVNAVAPEALLVVTDCRQAPHRRQRRWDPFKACFRGAKVLEHYSPAWYQLETAPTLLRGIDLSDYTLPTSFDD